jgi:amino acid transporter
MGILYIAMIVMSVMIAKRRLNDLNRSGWWFLLFIVPLINFVMAIYVIFFPGTEGSNNFGPAPERNSLGVKFLALMVPVVFIGVGILAAIAIPQYQDYVMRAGG